MGTPAARPRVVFVEDNPSIRTFIAMALEELPIDLILCADVAQAVACLRQAPARLVVTDLMLPGESGLSLLKRFVDEPALRGAAHLAVFSAGIRPEVRQQLDELGVWRVLAKPASLAVLEGCVTEALALEAPEEKDRPSAPGMPAPSSPERLTEADIVAQHFAGDRTLFLAYRSACLAQFPLDIQAGDLACAQADAPALQRLAHSLKTVLTSLGHPDLGEAARRMEQQAEVGLLSAAQTEWRAFRPRLRHLVENKTSSR